MSKAHFNDDLQNYLFFVMLVKVGQKRGIDNFVKNHFLIFSTKWFNANFDKVFGFLEFWLNPIFDDLSFDEVTPSQYE
jgi:hypothetical protein